MGTCFWCPFPNCAASVEPWRATVEDVPLVMTELKAANNLVYATAQGPVSVGGFSAHEYAETCAQLTDVSIELNLKNLK